MCVCVCVYVMHEYSVMSNSLWPHGLEPGKLQSMGFSRQEKWSGLLRPPLGIYGCMCAYMYTHTHTHIHTHICASKLLKLEVKICTLDYTFYFHKKFVKVNFKTCGSGTSPVVQWVRICLPMQGTRILSLAQEDSTCCAATKPVSHNYWAHVPTACGP